jgi:hypothetical protein
MRMLDEEKDCAVSRCTILLTQKEAEELRDSIAAVLMGGAGSHEHIPSDDFQKEITVALYDATNTGMHSMIAANVLFLKIADFDGAGGYRSRTRSIRPTGMADIARKPALSALQEWWVSLVPRSTHPTRAAGIVRSSLHPPYGRCLRQMLCEEAEPVGVHEAFDLGVAPPARKESIAEGRELPGVVEVCGEVGGIEPAIHV